jgi:integrase
MLSAQLLGILRTYWRLARPTHWLFPGRDADRRPGAARRLPLGLRRGRPLQAGDGTYAAAQLRHAPAGGGTDIRIIQVLLGHANLSSTARYTSVSNGLIRRTASPLDRLTLEVVPPA